jgi:hypothetical protein
MTEKGWTPHSCFGPSPLTRHSFEDWVFLVRTSIIGGMIANQVTEWAKRGHGSPTKEAMARFAEEAAAVADLWEES